MFSRRRSRSHYDPAQYNTGIRTPSASASAAANAYYFRQLGPSAAAEAIRRHSLDQSDAEAIRDFRPTSHFQSQPATRRTNSMTNTPPPRRANSLTSRSYQVTYNTPQPQQRFYAPQNSMVGRPPRRNSLSSRPGERSNSLTRTETVANRDASGRTLSLTTTTIRQMGAFEIVTTKDIPVSSPLRQPRGPYHHDLDAGSSVHSIDSELVGIQEDPEEDVDHVPMPSPLRSPAKSPAKQAAAPMSPESSSESRASLSDVSDATPSPPDSPQANTNLSTLVPPVPPQSKHRESSPARSALRQSTVSSGDLQSAKPSHVSFGGDKEFVYESYTYENDDIPPPAKPAGLAAATAAARARHQQQQQRPPQKPVAQKAPPPQSQQKLVMTQPPLAVTKRASEQSLRSKRTGGTRPASSAVGGGLPYPQARSWETQQHSSDDDDLQFVDAPDPGVPARSAARAQQSYQVPQPSAQDEEEAVIAQRHAQAVALAQQQFNKENAEASAAKNVVQNGQPKHYYRSLLAPATDSHDYDDDDRASIRSDSSFTRQSQARQQGPMTQRSSQSASNHRMKSLRQPQTPTLRSGGASDRGRKGSLLNQARPQMAEPAPAAGVAQSQQGGFRAYSLRQQSRPDPAALLSGAPPSSSGGGGGAFRSRVADSDSEDEGYSSKGNNGTVGGKISLGDVFSPSTDVKDIFKSSRSQSEQLPKPKKSGFFKRMFAKRA